MSAATPSPQSRPNSAPPYYLARPASVWIIALHRRSQASAARRPSEPAAMSAP